MALVIVVVYGVRYFQNSKIHNGATLESRKVCVKEKYEGIRITEEIRIDDYIVSGIVDTNGDYGFAVFEPKGTEKYILQSTCLAEQGHVAIGQLRTGEKAYNLFWSDQTDLDRAEIIYTDQSGNEMMEPIILDAEENNILYHEAPDSDYTVTVVYYDHNGNSYE